MKFGIIKRHQEARKREILSSAGLPNHKLDIAEVVARLRVLKGRDCRVGRFCPRAGRVLVGGLVLIDAPIFGSLDRGNDCGV